MTTVKQVEFLKGRIESLHRQLEDSKLVAKNRKAKNLKLVQLVKRLRKTLANNGIEYTD